MSGLRIRREENVIEELTDLGDDSTDTIGEEGDNRFKKGVKIHVQ